MDLPPQALRGVLSPRITGDHYLDIVSSHRFLPLIAQSISHQEDNYDKRAV